MIKTTKSTLSLLALAAVVSLALVGCGESNDDNKQATPTVSVTDVWTRVTAPGAERGAAYMSLKSADGDKLIGAEAPSITDRTEIHETTIESGSTGGSMGGDSMDGSSSMKSDTMKMQKVDSIDLPAGKTVMLKPGGYHVMFFDLKEQIKDGQKVELTLIFEKAGRVDVTATAKR
jgi:copper(I)-binding protein